ncbi:MAG: transposase, partial [Cardiobacteriaceae bacterium]|nr:transposase [Cardiobacteriaceae bacterium]
NHIKIDAKSKFIDTYEVTTASTHDSKVLEKLLEKSDRGQKLYADSAYIGQPIKKMLNKYGVKSFILEKGYRNKPLRVAQKIINRLRSKIRVRIEHIFGFMKNSMGGKHIVVPFQNNTALASPRRILDTVFGSLPCLILN